MDSRNLKNKRKKSRGAGEKNSDLAGHHQGIVDGYSIFIDTEVNPANIKLIEDFIEYCSQRSDFLAVSVVECLSQLKDFLEKSDPSDAAERQNSPAKNDVLMRRVFNPIGGALSQFADAANNNEALGQDGDRADMVLRKMIEYVGTRMSQLSGVNDRLIKAYYDEKLSQRNKLKLFFQQYPQYNPGSQNRPKA